MKLLSSGFGILSILVSMLSGMGFSDINESNVQNYVASDCISTANFIEQNFHTFVSSYNETIDDKDLTLNATYVEAKKNVTNITDNSQAVYLDFDDNNGYALVSNDYKLLDFATTGDLYHLKNVDTLLFSEFDGFVYETEYGYARYDVDYKDEEFWKDVEFGRFYDGQYTDLPKEGSGRIYDPIAYIKDRYGSGYNALPAVELKDYQNVIQRDYKVYSKRNSVGDEGNCTLSAMFGIMQYLRDYKSMKKLPHGFVEINPKNDYFYNSVIKNYKTASTTIIPKIYKKIRDKSIDYGYTVQPTPITSLNMGSIYKNVMNDFGYFKSFAQMILFWSFESQVKAEIDAGNPTIWNTLGGQYGAHSMVVKGYQQFYKEKRFWFFKWFEFKNLMILNDNWRRNDTFFDLTGYANNLLAFEGLGTFLRIRN